MGLLLLFVALSSIAGPDCPKAEAVAHWVRHHGGQINPALRVAASAACGGSLGIFADETIAADTPLCTIPLSLCISASDACLDPAIGGAVASFLEAHQGRGAAEPMCVAQPRLAAVALALCSARPVVP